MCLLFILGLLLYSRSTLFAQVYVINTIAGTGPAGYSGDGKPATSAMLYYPLSVSLDSTGNLYIADWDNSRIRKIDQNGVISTIAGNGKFTYSGDGGPAVSSGLNGPTGVFSDPQGNVYLTDIGNGRIREITTQGKIFTVAGNGSYGFSGDGGPATASSFKDPTGVVLDDSGNVYVADVFNNRIRKINKTGIITTIAGNGVAGYAGDGGPATLAELYYPTGIAIDNEDNIYIADEDNNRIRKISSGGIITTVAGDGTASFSGDEGPATLAGLNFPAGVAIDKLNNLYIADAVNNRIRMVNTKGVISTIAGNGVPNYEGDGGLALTASLYNPTSVTIDTSGNLFIGDAFNFRVRKLTRINREISSGIDTISIYPNPNFGIFNVQLQNATSSETIYIYNIIGEKIYSANLNQNSTTEINLAGLRSGVYLYKIATSDTAIAFHGKVVILHN
ncbi:MAG TPA: T9SS type A sorting domain-containing protein [Bacteroidia bacterium]|nr:T9SS type A sorting domain-containing protein [Bacteroidia bacterium]